MILYVPAKVNLYLRVLGKRPDGYHNIETIFEKIALFDKIVLRSLKNNETRIFTDHPGIPVDEASLMARTIRLIRKKTKVSKGVEVKIFKKIPVAAGLGGGSSNAAGILLGLNKMWKLSLSPSELCRLGGVLGADIPLFLGGSSFARGESRGDKITPFCRKKSKLWHLLISPPVKVLSKDVYRKVGTAPFGDSPYSPKGFTPKFMWNDLENIVCGIAPVVTKLKSALEKIGLKRSLVSGSGPSVFSLFERRSEAEKAKKLLVKRFPFVKSKGWQIFVVSTL